MVVRGLSVERVGARVVRGAGGDPRPRRRRDVVPRRHRQESRDEAVRSPRGSDASRRRRGCRANVPWRRAETLTFGLDRRAPRYRAVSGGFRRQAALLPDARGLAVGATLHCHVKLAEPQSGRLTVSLDPIEKGTLPSGNQSLGWAGPFLRVAAPPRALHGISSWRPRRRREPSAEYLAGDAHAAI